MRHLRAVFVILFLLLVFIVAVQNYSVLTTPIKFRADLIFYEYETSGMPVALVAVITFAVGVILMGGYGMFERFRLKRQIKELARAAEQKDKELSSLRNLPVTSDDMGSGHPSDT